MFLASIGVSISTGYSFTDSGFLAIDIFRLRVLERTLCWSSLPAVLYFEPFDFGEYEDSLSAVTLPMAIAALSVFPKVFFLELLSFEFLDSTLF